MSASIPVGTFADAAYFSIYESTNAATLRPDLGQFDSVGSIFDATFNGFTNQAPGVSIQPSSRGPDWWTVLLTNFTPTYSFIAPTLEVYNFNGISNDSTGPMTDVVVSSVPEPRVAALLCLALVIVPLARRFRLLAVLCCVLLPTAAPLRAQTPVALGARVRVTTGKETSAFDRATRLITQTADVTVTNMGDRPVKAPLRVRVALAGDGDLSRVVLSGVQAGGEGDSRAFYDLSPLLPAGGLAPNASLGFQLRLTRPSAVTVFYQLETQGVFNRDPSAAFDAPLAAVVGEEVAFDAGASDDGDGGKQLSYAWNFGDGGTSDAIAPKRTFAKPGRYDVTLAVTDSEEAKAVLRKTITVLPSANFAVARTRTLDTSGQPLGGVAVGQRAGTEVTESNSDAATGFAALGGEPGEYVWRFARDGYLPAWRKATLSARQILFVPSPWLVRENAKDKPVSPLRELVLGGTNEPATITFTAGSFAAEGAAGFTPIAPQALPLPLPAGWSPLGAFYLSLPSTPSQSGALVWAPSDKIGSDDALAMLKYDADLLQWTVASLPTPVASPSAVVNEAGTYALVVADKGARAPPSAQVGAALPSATDIAFDSSTISATGSVDPSKITASREAAAMTTAGRVVFTGASDLPSGTYFRTEIEETYNLANGRTQRTPVYDTSFFAYQRPGDADAKTLHASFPLRPTRLISPEQIETAKIVADILTGDSYAASLFDQTGGRIAADNLAVSAEAGDLSGRSLAELRLLDIKDFEVPLAGRTGVAAFQLAVGNLATDRGLNVELSGLAPSKDFVVARYVAKDDEEGLEPVERLRSDANGNATSVEPTEGVRLPGLTGPGQYVVLAVDGPQAVVSGIARNLAGDAVAGLAVRIGGFPWLTFSASDGAYKLVAPKGATSTVSVTDLADGNSGSEEVVIPAGATAATANVRAAITAPRVANVFPADGAEKVRAATPVKIRFSEPIDPATFGPGAMTLTNPLGVLIQGSLSLNPAGTEATFLPTNPLDLGATYTIELSVGIKDRQSLPLEGTRKFSFSVVPLVERAAGAQLVIYEPGAKNIPQDVRSMLVGYSSAEGSSHVVAHGSAGTADAEVPVVLVNQNTGETATVLSKPDGSFASFINAAEEDFIEAVFVNANGMRVTVPATKQIYDNGRIGLYKYGGILEAESDGGPVKVIIEPGAILQRNVFKVDTVAMTELLALVRNTQPENGKLLGGVRIGMEGDALKVPPDLSYPVKESDLGLPSDKAPQDGIYALTQSEVTSEGTVVYNQVDKMEFEEGRLVTHSPPYPGLVAGAVGQMLYLPVRIGFGSKITVVGRVVAAPDSEPYPTEKSILEGRPPITPIPGATVNAQPQVGTRLRPGSFVARTNKNGFYALTVPYDFMDPGPVLVRALILSFPGVVAQASGTFSGLAEPGTVPVLTLNPVFRRPTSELADTLAPLLSTRPPSASLSVGQDNEVLFFARDDQSQPEFRSIEPDLSQSTAVGPGEVLHIDDIRVTRGDTAVFGNSLEEKVKLRCQKAAIVAFKATAGDRSGNERTAVFKFRFGPATPPSGDDPASNNPHDDQRPVVDAVSPASDLMLSGNSAVLFLNERVKRDPAEAENVVTLSPPGKVHTRLSPDGTKLLLEFGDLRPNTTYTATLSSSAIKDLAGNVMADSYTYNFRTPPTSAVALQGPTSAVGSLVFGSFAAAISRDSSSSGLLTIHRVGDTDDKTPVGTLRLPVYPRAIAEIGLYSFKKTPTSPVEKRRLLAVSGGVVGTDSAGPWLWLVDVTDPSAPTRLASSLVSADATQVVGVMRWENPFLMLAISGSERSFICQLNPQAFILGSNAAPGDGTLVPRYERGADLNGDGDYVDEAERLPKPQVATLFGTENVLPLAKRRFITDFDARLGGRLTVALLGRREVMRDDERVSEPPGLQVMLADGVFVGDGSPSDEGFLEYPSGTPRRVVLDLDFPVKDATGTRIIPAALVAIDSRIEIIDLTNPSRPVRLDALNQRLNLASYGGGQIFSVQRSDSDEYTVATSTGLFVLPRSAIGDPQRSPGILEFHPDAPFSGRFSGASPLAFTTTNGELNIINRAPRIAVFRVPGQPVQDSGSLLALDENGRSAFIRSSVESGYLTPTFLSVDPANLVSLDPPDPQYHHYVRVRAPGHLGPQLKISVESLDAGGNLNPPVGEDYAPVLLTDSASDVGLPPPVQPAVTSVVAKRLSSDPTSDLFNEYVSAPLVIFRQKPGKLRVDALPRVDGRKMIWSGSFLRFGFDADVSADTDLLPYVGKASRQFQPGLTRTYLSLRPEYIDSPNPSFPLAAVRVAGVDLQSGEFSLPTVDWSLKGRLQDLTLQRVYQSRSQYIGPFGRGWDHNYNARVFEIPADAISGVPLASPVDGALKAKPGDILLIDGAGSSRLYRRISEDNDNLAELGAYKNDPAVAEFIKPDGEANIAEYYESPRGVFNVIYKLKDGSWLFVGPTAQRILFRSDGRLDRIIGAFEKSQLVCHYRPGGLLDRVEGDRGVSLEFGYYFPFLDLRRTGADLPSEDPLKTGKVARVRSSSTLTFGLEVRYDYDARGCLAKVTPNLGRETTLTYNEENGDLLERVGSGDGTEAPAQEIHYSRDKGLVTNVKFAGQEISFRGAVATTKERADADGGEVSATLNSHTTQYTVDGRGSPTGFNGRGFKADEATGLPVRTDSVSQEVRSVYDTANPVRRFRGNLLRTERGKSPDLCVSETIYDGTAFNRPKKIKDVNGIETIYDYLGAGAGSLQVQETRGAVTRTTRYNDYGQQTSEDISDAGGSLFTTSFDLGLGGYDRDLVTANRFTTTTSTTHDVFGRPEKVASGSLDFSIRYNGDSQPEWQGATAPGVAPQTDFFYDSVLRRLERQTVRGGGSSVETIYSYADERFPGKASGVLQRETGYPPSAADYTYNDHGQLESVTIEDETTTLEYDGALNTQLEGPGINRTVDFEDGSRNIKSVTENGVETTFTYDRDRISSYKTGNLTTELTYDAPVAPSTVSERLQKKTLKSGANILLQETFHYDRGGRLSSITSFPSGRTRDFSYFPDGVLKEMQIDGKTMRSVERDQAGRTLESRLNNTKILYSDWDEAGRANTETLTFLDCPGTATFQRDFDAAGRLKRTTIAGAGSTDYGYDLFGNLVSIKDPDGVSFSQDMTPSGQPLTTTFSDGTTAVHTYDVHRRQVSVSGSSGSLGFQYADGLVSRIDYPDGTSARFEQRNDFFAPELVTQGGHPQTHSYDDLGRLEAIDVPSTGDTLTYGYDDLGRRTNSDLNGASVVFGYDEGGSLVSETTAAGTWRQDVNSLNHVLSETYPSGFSVDYRPNDYGQPASMTAAGVSGITWHAAGLPGEIRYTGGVRQIRDYDAALRPTSFKWVAGSSANSPVAAGYSYELTAGGRVLSEQRMHQSEYDVFQRNSPGQGMRITDFLFGAQNKDGANPVASLAGFTFANGEISAVSVRARSLPAGADPRGFFPDVVRGGNKLTSIDGTAVSYDDAGSMTSFPLWVVLPGQTGLTKVGATASYDGLGLLRQILRDDGVTITYTRDGLGRIGARSVSGPANRCNPGSTIYVWKGSSLIEERGETSPGLTALLRRYIWLGRDLVLVQSATTPGGPMVDFIPLTTINRSIGGYLSRDGQLLETINYGAYGLPLVRGAQETGRSLVGSSLLFHGGFFDEATGLYQFGQRNLHPILGQFLQRDNALFAESLAWFTAFNGDPAGRIDPAGTLSEAASGEVGFGKDLKEQVDAAREVKDAASKLVEAVNDGSGTAGAALDLLSKTIALGKTSSDESIKDKFELASTFDSTIDAFKTGAEVLESVSDMKADRSLLKAVKKMARAEMTGGATAGALRTLTEGGALAGVGKSASSGSESGLLEMYKEAADAKGGPLSSAEFRSHVRSTVAERRKDKLLSVAGNLTTLGNALAEEYLSGEDRASVTAKQYLSFQSSVIDAATKANEALQYKDLTKLQFSLLPFEGMQDLLAHWAILEAAWKMGNEAGKLGVSLLADDIVAKAYLEAQQQFAENGGWAAVAGGILSTFGCDRGATIMLELGQWDTATALKNTAQTLIDENRRHAERRDAYLNGINEP